MKSFLTPNEIIEKFSAIKKRQHIVAVVVVLVILFGLLVKYGSHWNFDIEAMLGLNQYLFGKIFLVIVVAALLYSFKNWRCPACNKYFGKSMRGSFCPHCGVQLAQQDPD